MWHDVTGAGWAWMSVGMLVFWLVLLAIGVGIISALLGQRPGRPGEASPRRDALAVLDDRLARGELDVEEYRARRRALDHPAG